MSWLPCAVCAAEDGSLIEIPENGDCRTTACAKHRTAPFVLVKRPPWDPDRQSVVVPLAAVAMVDEDDDDGLEADLV